MFIPYQFHNNVYFMSFCHLFQIILYFVSFADTSIHLECFHFQRSHFVTVLSRWIEIIKNREDIINNWHRIQQTSIDSGETCKKDWRRDESFWKKRAKSEYEEEKLYKRKWKCVSSEKSERWTERKTVKRNTEKKNRRQS